MFTQLKTRVVLLFVLLVSACTAQQPPAPLMDAAPSSGAGDTRLAGEEANLETELRQEAPPSDDIDGRVILMDASLTLVVDDATAKVIEVRTMALEMGGWVVSSSTSFSTNAAGDEVAYGNITVRVPSERLYEALDRIKMGVGRVVSENVSGQDVTQDYVDTESQIANLETTRAQLQTIMDSARVVDDVLRVQAELTRVQGEIETARGRLRYYDEASAYSSISISLSPPDAPLIQTDNWNPLNTAQSAFNNLLRALRGIVDLVIMLVVYPLPLGILFGVPAWFIWRRVRRNITLPKQTPPPSA